MTDEKLLMGNEAIGRALVEAGCNLICAYPGTPSSEILEAAAANLEDAANPIHIEWSVNEKIAYETALAGAYTGKRTAAIMKQVGLNVAADPFARSTYIGVKGGFVVVVADDPGPHSSQNEQDTRLFSLFAKAPVFDPSSPAEAREMVSEALELSEKYELPVVLRPTTRICHSRQNITPRAALDLQRRAHFEKNPGRWVATPAFLPSLHAALNEKLAKIAAEPGFAPRTFRDFHSGPAIVASGIAYANTADLLTELGLADEITLYQVRLPFPLHREFSHELSGRHERILVLEETDSVIEMQMAGDNISGRRDGLVPGHGELTPDVISEIIDRFLERSKAEKSASAPARGRRPSLCPGCPHRAAFYAIRKTFPKGIFPSDIGCYTLGLNLGAVDTCHCMGACISQGAGFYFSHAQDGNDFPTVVVTIGDSTFFH
ncbi:MAG: indolepyruvate oxidoreductase, partial [Deltaproteobacteria bacterium]|nr:indolepyruvate oxidoreductase [Deltaproteobacteria bacterium]